MQSPYKKKDSGFKLDSNNQKWLQTNNIWAILIDEDTKTVTWQTDDLPETIPKSYSLSAISSLTSGYIDGYPTYTGASEGGIVVLGYPKRVIGNTSGQVGITNLLLIYPKQFLLC